MKFEFNLSLEELEKRTNKEYLIRKPMLAKDADEYAKLDWEFPGEGDEIIVIHTLCIDINQQGKGLGKEFVDFALEHGRKLGCKAMRLDTYEFNEQENLNILSLCQSSADRNS